MPWKFFSSATLLKLIVSVIGFSQLCTSPGEFIERLLQFLNSGPSFKYYGALGVTAKQMLWKFILSATLVKLIVSVIGFSEIRRSQVEFIMRLLQLPKSGTSFEYYCALGVTTEKILWNCLASATLVKLNVSVCGFPKLRRRPDQYNKKLL